MTELAVVGASAEAGGHPATCGETATGEVQSTSNHGITVTVGGTSKEVATKASADIHFDSHGHGVNDGSCVNFQTHDIDPDDANLDTGISINGSPVYLVEDSVTTDPGSGGAVDITDNPFESQRTKN